MTETAGETVTFDIETADEHSAIELPRALVELFADEDDSPTDVVADVAQFDFTRRIYEAAHGENEVEADVRAIEMDTLALFEAHFGTSFEAVLESEGTGHDDQY